MVLGLLALASFAQSPTIPVEEVSRGQKGYGLSVFAGGDPERFEVEVIGVMRNFAPNTSYILARLSGHGLEESGVAAGMSGSPVYLDERLAGAVAFSWPFTNGAIAGITPIQAMRQMSGLAGGIDMSTGTLKSVDLEQLASGRVPNSLLKEHLKGLLGHPLEGARSGLQWSSVGMGESTRKFLSTALSGYAPAGQAAGDLGDLVPGSSVAGVLVDGDFQLAVTGTVTDREGEEILAFGHPFLGIGPLSLPMATSEVVTILPSKMSSFKIANIGEVVGAFDLDLSNGIRGRVGLEAPTVPMTVRVQAERTSEYHLRLADLPGVTASLVAISALSGLDAGARSGGDSGVDLDVRFDLGDHGQVALQQSFDGFQAGLNAAIYVFGLATYLLDNPMAEVHLESVDVELIHHPRPRTVRLLGAHAAAGVVEPGQTIQLNLELAPFRGEPYRQRVEVVLPDSLSPGPYSLLVGDGASITAARLTVEHRVPESLGQAIEFINNLRSRKELVVLGVVFDSGIAGGGTSRPRLPGSIQSLWEASGTLGATALTLAVVQEVVEDLEMPMEGVTRVDLTVRPSLGGSER